MTKGIFLLACAVLVAVMLVVPGFLPDPILKAALIAIVVLGLAALYWFDLRREANDRKRAAAHASARSEALAVAARSRGFQLKVNAASQIVLAWIVFFLGAAFLGVGILSANVLSAIGGGIGTAAGLLLLLRAVPAVGKPKLVLSREGFSTPLTPSLSWSVVHGMDLETFPLRWGTEQRPLVFQKLVFYIPSLPEHLPRFGLFHRLVYPLRDSAGRQRLEVILRNPSEPGDAVYDLAMLYWKQATGRSNEPDPLALFDRVHPPRIHEMPTSGGTGLDPALLRLIEADVPDGEEKTRMLTNLARTEAGERRMKRYQDAARAAWRERRRRARYGVLACATIAGALLYFDAFWALSAMTGVIGVAFLYVAFFEQESSLLPPGRHVAGWAATLERDPGAEERIMQSYQRRK